MSDLNVKGKYTEARCNYGCRERRFFQILFFLFIAFIKLMLKGFTAFVVNKVEGLSKLKVSPV